MLYLDNALTLAEAVVPYSSALQEYIAGPSGSLLGYQTSDADAQDHMCLQASHLCGLGFWVRYVEPVGAPTTAVRSGGQPGTYWHS